ncbi:DNA alkylation repair protein [Bacteroides sp.]|uniref:DNA alkylation repair protein n=1 Tax=Bacteroides sp. TaxID=29523 RepID=UPI002603F4E1|nr:DNA alkylation repair protein [Bacteroides sp.]MDD3039116.1 DNA alkylation repair protein [Bacteroides sp.]
MFSDEINLIGYSNKNIMLAEDSIQVVRQMLKESIDSKTLGSSDRFFKQGEQAKVHGVRMCEVGKIAKEFYKEASGRTKAEIFALCDLLKNKIKNDLRAIFTSFLKLQNYVFSSKV